MIDYAYLQFYSFLVGKLRLVTDILCLTTDESTTIDVAINKPC